MKIAKLLFFITLLLGNPLYAEVFYSTHPSGLGGLTFISCSTCEEPQDFVEFAQHKALSDRNFALTPIGVVNGLDTDFTVNPFLLNLGASGSKTYVVVNTSTESYHTVRVFKRTFSNLQPNFVFGTLIGNSSTIDAFFNDYQLAKNDFVLNHYYVSYTGLQSPWRAPLNLVGNVIEYGEVSESWGYSVDSPDPYLTTPNFIEVVSEKLNRFLLTHNYNPFHYVDTPMAVQLTTADKYEVLLIKPGSNPQGRWLVVYVAREYHLYERHGSYSRLSRTKEKEPTMSCFSTNEREICRELRNGWLPIGPIHVRVSSADDPIDDIPQQVDPKPPEGCNINSQNCLIE